MDWIINKVLYFFRWLNSHQSYLPADTIAWTPEIGYYDTEEL